MSDPASVTTQRISILGLHAAHVRDWGLASLAGAGAFLTIFTLAELAALTKQLLLIAPFGASCVLVFALPDSPLAQNRNLIGGHVLSAAVGLIVLHVLGVGPLAYGVGVGCAIATMMLTKTVHPPAGANPIVVIAAGSQWNFLLAPVLVGTLIIASFAWIWRFARRKAILPSR